MAEDDSSEDIGLYFIAAEVGGKHPPAVFFLADPVERKPPGDAGALCQCLFESDEVPSVETRKQKLLLKFMNNGNLMESVELELSTTEDQNLGNLGLEIYPAKEIAVVHTYDTPDVMIALQMKSIFILLFCILSLSNTKLFHFLICNYKVQNSGDQQMCTHWFQY